MPIAVADTSACEGGSFKLSIANPIIGLDQHAYTWRYPNGTLLITSQDVTLSNVALTAGGRYIVEARYFGCIAVDTANLVKIKPRPAKPVVTADDTLCSGDTLHLSAHSTTPNITYKWTGANSFTSSSKDTIIADIPFSGNGYYKVVAYLDGCPSLPDSQKVVVNLTPPMDATNDGPLCEGATLSLKAVSNTPDVTYSWTGPSGFSSLAKDTAIINAQLNHSGMYILHATLGKCIIIDTTIAEIKPYPQKPVAESNSSVCSDSILKLRVTNIAPGVKYSWTGPKSYISAQADNDISGIALDAAGEYILTANLNGCTRKDTIGIVIKPTPSPPIASSNSPLKEGETLKINIVNPIAGAIYRWSGPLGFFDTSLSLSIANIKKDAEGIYVVNVNLNGCNNAAQTIIVINIQNDTGVFSLYPNPNNGNFTINGFAGADQQTTLEVFNSIGQMVYREAVATVNAQLNKKIEIPYIASGVYSLQFKIDGKRIVFPFVVNGY
jgi:hypothetical protein